MTCSFDRMRDLLVEKTQHWKRMMPSQSHASSIQKCIKRIVNVVNKLNKNRLSVGLRLGHSLIAIANVLLTDTLKSNPQNKIQIKLAKDSQLVMETNWTTEEPGENYTLKRKT